MTGLAIVLNDFSGFHTLVFPREKRRLSGFAHGPAFFARWNLSFPAKQTVRRIVAHVQRVAFPLHDSLRLS